MAKFISGETVSHAWIDAAAYLLEAGGEDSNLCVYVEDAMAEVSSVRNQLSNFRDEMAQAGGYVPPAIDSVASTIFPRAYYVTRAEDPESHLYDLESRVRRVVRRHPQNRRGTYFERLVAYPLGIDEPVNQLQATLAKLRAANKRNWRKGNQYELSIFHPGRDKSPEGFPCLSHISLTLRRGRIEATAVYRNQYLLGRAYGNYLGLGRLVTFLANESGYQPGPLMCVASHAELETARYGKRRLADLLKESRELVELDFSKDNGGDGG